MKKHFHGRRHIRARKSVAEGRAKRQYIKLMYAINLLNIQLPIVIEKIGEFLSIMIRAIESIRLDLFSQMNEKEKIQYIRKVFADERRTRDSRS